MMLLVTLRWWYTAGWSGLVGRVGRRIDRVMESFSVTLLLGSLFDPFRQIDAGSSVGSAFDAQLRAFGNRLFSRAFGAVVRSLFIVIGLLAALLVAIVGVLQIVLWPVVPFFPLLSIIAAILKVGL